MPRSSGATAARSLRWHRPGFAGGLRGHRILSLGGDRWFAWIHGRRGEILVHSDADHQKDHTIQKGRFFVVQFQDDPKFKDMPHLFLQKGGRYQELMLPNDLPSENDPQKKIVSTKDTIGKEELERYLRHPKPAGAGEERLRGLDQKQLDRVKRYEKAHKNRKTVLEAIDRHFD